MTLEQQIGRAARMARQARRMTVWEMADIIHGEELRTRSRVYAFESGRSVTWRFLKEVAQALHTTPAGLLLIAENMGKTDAE